MKFCHKYGVEHLLVIHYLIITTINTVTIVITKHLSFRYLFKQRKCKLKCEKNNEKFKRNKVKNDFLIESCEF